MKLVFLSNLIGNEILAKDIHDPQGATLLKAGTKITKTYISTLKGLGTFFIYVEDNGSQEAKEDLKLKGIKDSVLETLPKTFDNISVRDFTATKQAVESIDNITEYIYHEGTLNTNLYELKTYDNYTYIHGIDTAMMAIFLGTKLRFDKDTLIELGLSALLHNIGNLKISHDILYKQSKLSTDEFDEIKKHTKYSREILESAGCFSNRIIAGAAHHHEKFDGTGYPYGLTGSYISLFGRIISLCSTFTAVSSDRPYRKRFEPNDAYELILSRSGTHFDPRLVQLFKSTFSIYPLGSMVQLSNGDQGYVVRQNPNFPDKPVVSIVRLDQGNKTVSSHEINLAQTINVVITKALESI
ncbi:HD-GYP domain-containing protein [Clostridium cellulovorans]|uniref:Metal dependent phosphohydrolase n=1 Tax=Clostridium cellulovorans (strain ATCC 35296 / DSM 3052 / OCM 3 / 743B) TaxID=573061 RepID=D9SPB0_CLOC7|nr:HD-GYP domain-containing protein [Clostridium cellulovorans]ADL54012.1 metal dependent phosphohydrolase [Clostridium cellulovorans 743B]